MPGVQVGVLKTTRYFDFVRQRPDRAQIADAWIERVIQDPEYERIQPDCCIRRYGRVPEAEYRWLRVVPLEDGESMHNAFYDRRFRP